MPAISRSDLDTLLVKNIGLDPAQLTAAGATLADLGVDSIGVIELEKVLADQYGAALPEEAPAMSVEEILDHVNHTVGSAR